MLDPISDMLTRIRNALQVKFDAISMPSSSLKVDIARVLKEEGYIKNYKMLDDKKQGVLKVYLKYGENKTPAIEGIKRVSKQSLRLYKKKDDIPITLNGYGVTIMSTSKGVMSDKNARKENVGGEVICKVW
jgi:small subunit ribosomal protein S8